MAKSRTCDICGGSPAYPSYLTLKDRGKHEMTVATGDRCKPCARKAKAKGRAR